MADDTTAAQNRLTVVKQDLGVLQPELYRALAQKRFRFLLFGDSIAAYKGNRLVHCADEPDTGLQRTVLVAHIASKMQEFFLYLTRIQSMQSGES